MSRGYVYILSNPAMPGVLKIGKTTRSPESRASELFQTGVPVPFVVEKAVDTPDCNELEQTMHEQFDETRVNSGREFFSCCLDEAMRRLDEHLLCQIDYMVCDYLPDHVVTKVNGDSDGIKEKLNYIAAEIGVEVGDVAVSLANVTAEEARPFVERYLAQEAKDAEAAPALKLVGGDTP